MNRYRIFPIIMMAALLLTQCATPTPVTVVETVVVTEIVTEVEEVIVTKEVIVEVMVTAEPEVKDETGPRTLTFFTTEADPPQLEVLGEIIDEYNEANPDVFIDVVTGTPSTRGQRITTLLAAGADAGIFEIEAAFTREWAEAGYLMPLTDVFEGIGGVDEYGPGSYFEFEDEVYALPYATSVYCIWYSTDIFEEAGLEPPTNYEE